MVKSVIDNFVRWFDSEANLDSISDTDERFSLVRCMPFILLHLSCLFVILVGFSWTAFWVALGFFWLRMFAITGFYHRYFAHKSFKTSRAAQFIFAVLGCSSAQRGPLWWAAHHRDHHRYSDTEKDLHSPVQRGFWWSHMGWFTCEASFRTKYDRIKDFAKFPELRWLNRYDTLIPILAGVALFLLGVGLNAVWPDLGTSGSQMLVWGFCVSTVVLFHATFTINSLGHVFGSRRYETRDESRNNFFLALLTLGEGWHNNHHRWPSASRQGFFWWEVDITYYILKLMSWCGLVWELKPVPTRLLEKSSRD